MIQTKRVSFQEEVDAQYYEPHQKELISTFFYQPNDYVLFVQREQKRS